MLYFDPLRQEWDVTEPDFFGKSNEARPEFQTYNFTYVFNRRVPKSCFPINFLETPAWQTLCSPVVLGELY